MNEILMPAGRSVEASFTGERDWTASLSRALRSGRELCERLGIDPKLACPQAEADFPVFVPLEYLAKMQPGNPRDPLLRQVLPMSDEMEPGGELDPVGDLETRIAPGLLQKYQGRALAITSGACAVHCRYCFRRHFPYHQARPGRRTWAAWIDVLQSDPSIDEVILSGGDPLTMPDSQLRALIEMIERVQTVKRLRIHSRFPVVIPSRLSDQLIDVLKSSRLAIFLVLHFNHAHEVADDVLPAIHRARMAGISLLNQSVLLRGVNDTLDDQVNLCRALVDQGVLPYYLHQLDPVRGAMHYGVPDSIATQIIAEMNAQLPGYAVPRLVREVPGAPGKTPL